MRPFLDSSECSNPKSSSSCYFTECEETFIRPIRSDPKTIIRVAGTIQDRCKAWALVNNVYQGKGYATKAGQRLWYGLHDALKDTITFLGERGGRVVATMSLVFDSPLKLPADGCFEGALDVLRTSRDRLCEIVSLVNVDSDRRSNLALTRAFFRLAFRTAKDVGKATDLTIVVNPKHASFYERVLLFERMGQETQYPRVGGAPAVLLRLKLEEVDGLYRSERSKGGLSRYRLHIVDGDSSSLTRWVRRNRCPMDERSFRHYFSGHRNLLWNADGHQREFLEEQYLSFKSKEAQIQ